jgi:hypothetical protein
LDAGQSLRSATPTAICKCWTTAGNGSRFGLLVHHTDSEREYAYERSPLGTLDKALTEAEARGWTVVDMKQDRKCVYPFETKG